MTTLAAFWQQVEKTATCWLWMGYTNRGYGYVSVDGRRYLTHRLSYELHLGAIGAGLTIDHLCRVRNCVNPDHLEAVPTRVNTLRGIGPTAINKRKMKCIRGHEFDEQNTRLTPKGRDCRACNAERGRRDRKDPVKGFAVCGDCGKTLVKQNLPRHMREVHANAALAAITARLTGQGEA